MEDATAEHPFITFLQHRLLQGTKKLKKGRSDDWADRMNHMYTALFLAVLAFLITFSVLTGDRIRCWVPAEFTFSYEEYIHHYCWVKNTYYYPMEDQIPYNISKHQAAEITYYQWVPLILFLQAIMFKLPNVLWEICHSYSGIKLGQIVSYIDANHHSSLIERRQVVENIGTLLINWLNKQKATGLRARLSNACFLCCYRRAGSFLTGLFVFCKLLYLLTAVGQFFMLNAFMASDFIDLGSAWVKMLTSGQPMRESHRFPRITLCDFKIRLLENVQDWTVQCVLPINLLNEKLFIIIWFWLIIISVINGYSIWKWLYLLAWKESGPQYAWKRIQILYGRNLKDKKICKEFARDFLRHDGCFVLRIIGKNTNEIVALDLLEYLYIYFKKTFYERDDNFKIDCRKMFKNDNQYKANGAVPHCDIPRDELFDEFRDRNGRNVHFNDFGHKDEANFDDWQHPDRNEDLLHFDEDWNNNGMYFNKDMANVPRKKDQNNGLPGPGNGEDTKFEFESVV